MTCARRRFSPDDTHALQPQSQQEWRTYNRESNISVRLRYMSGKGQHSIPVSLLQGFVIPGTNVRRKRRGGRVWVFHRRRGVQQVAAGDAAKERHFYSIPLPNTSTLDDQITNYENERNIGLTLRRLRQLPTGAAVDGNLAAELVSHLSARTAYVRNVFSDGIRHVSDAVSQRFCDVETFYRAVGADDLTIPSRFEEHMSYVYDKDFAGGVLPRAVVIRMAFMLLREREDIAEHAIPVLQGFLDGFSDSSSDIARKAHNEALAKDMAPAPRKKHFKEFEWTVRKTQDGDPFILPDCVVLASEDGEALEPIYMTRNNSIEAVFLAVSGDCMLVGQRSEKEIDLTRYNRAAARCSSDMFISSVRNKGLEELLGRIGERSDVLFHSVITEGMERLRPEVRRGSGDKRKWEDNHRSAGVAEVDAVKVNITLGDCPDKETGEAIARVVEETVQKLGKYLALWRLDEIAFVSDYDEACRDLTGSPGWAVRQDEDVTEVARTHYVFRGGVVRAQVVARMDVGLALVGSEEAKRLAFQCLVFCLAQVAERETFERTIAGEISSRIENQYECTLLERTIGCWRTYFAARISAGVEARTSGFYREVLINSLRRVMDEVPAARRNYLSDRDLDRMVSSVFDLMTNFLERSGAALGNHEALGIDILSESNELASDLQKAGLYDWFKSFRRDMEEMWARIETCSLAEYFIFNRHCERLLWQFGIFPWELPNGDMWVQVFPSASDTDQARP